MDKKFRKSLILALAPAVGTCISGIAVSLARGDFIGLVACAIFLGLLLILWVAVEKVLEAVHKHQEAALAALTGKNSLVVFPSFKDAIGYFGDHVPVLARVDNISVCTREMRETVEKLFIKTPWYPAANLKAVEFLKSGTLKFRDILTPYAVRIATHRRNLFAQAGIGFPFYEARVIGGAHAPLEFTIFHFNDGRPSEVLVGWHLGKDNASIVVKIAEPNIVKVFEEHFEQLWSKSRATPLSPDENPEAA